MSRRLATTPRSKVKAALSTVFLRSRERAACLKAHGYRCARCQRKQSKAKGHELSLQVHHLEAAEEIWQQIYELVYALLLVSPDKLVPMCRECHDEIHQRKKVETDNGQPPQA